MKELFIEINKRFDQVYKKIDRLESKMDKGFVKVTFGSRAGGKGKTTGGFI